MIHIFLFISLLAIGVPIAFVLGVASLLFFAFEGGSLIIFPQRMFVGINNSVLMCIPFFILAGNIMNAGGITKEIMEFAKCLVGWIRGSLGMVSIVASMIFAGITGSAQADAAAIGSVLLPAMKEEGYDEDFSAALVTAAGVIGPIIPPSIMFIIYGVVGGVSIGALFAGGLIPGVIIGLSLMIITYYYARKRKYPKSELQSARNILVAFLKAIPALMMPVIIVGSILSGIATATEAAAVSVLYSLIVGFFVYRKLRLSDLPKIIMESANLTTSIMIIISTAMIFAWLLTYANVPRLLTSYLLSISSNKFLFLFFVNILFLFIGTWMDPTAAMIVFVPVLLPSANAFGIDPIHFGLVVAINLVVGLATPPIGYLLYTMVIISGVKVEKLSRALLPFLIIEVLVLFLVTYVPWFGLVLPRYFGYVK